MATSPNASLSMMCCTSASREHGAISSNGIPRLGVHHTIRRFLSGVTTHTGHSTPLRSCRMTSPCSGPWSTAPVTTQTIAQSYVLFCAPTTIRRLRPAEVRTQAALSMPRVGWRRLLETTSGMMGGLSGSAATRSLSKTPDQSCQRTRTPPRAAELGHSASYPTLLYVWLFLS